MNKIIKKILTSAIIGATMLTSAAAFASEPLTYTNKYGEVIEIAAQTPATILVNGEVITCRAYEIYDHTYFKLRDVAAALVGTEVGFAITWNSDLYAIEMLSNTPYITVGGDLVISDYTTLAYVPSVANIYLDGEKVEMEAYELNSSNYFKLRDLAEVIGFNVDWDEATQSIAITAN